jgi:hypothetical protein
MGGMVVPNGVDGKELVITANVELIRAKDGAPAAPQQAYLTTGLDPLIGSTEIEFRELS